MPSGTLVHFRLQTLWEHRTTTSDWSNYVRQLAVRLHTEDQGKVIASHSSLLLFSCLGHFYSHGTHPYLDDRSNLRGTRLKTALRTGTMWTMSRVASALGWPASGGLCLLCKSAPEDPQHLLTGCAVMEPHLAQLVETLLDTMSQAAGPGVYLANEFRRAFVDGERRRMLLMLAGAEIDFPLDPGADVDAHAEWCGKALWLFDRVAKNYLVRCCTVY